MNFLDHESATPTVVRAKKIESIEFLDPLQRHHVGRRLIFSESGRPKALLEIELAPDPEEREERAFGLPVLYYRFAPLADGKAEIQLLDDKTIWEVDAHTPKWEATGIVAPKDTTDDDATLQNVVDRVSIQRPGAREDQQRLGVPIKGRSLYDYRDPSQGILRGGIFDTQNSTLQQPLSNQCSDAFVAIELRIDSDGNREWFIAMLRNSTDELGVNIDGREVCRLPALKEPVESKFPIRIEKF